ncbi:MAG: tRNA lysidine(34) synthetase TilS [Bacillota bacterium]|jgi:tRNA(Ile)-lysidine synthase
MLVKASGLLVKELRAVLVKHELFKTNRRLLVGCSGGPDSTALLHALWSLRESEMANLYISVVHVNHGLRPLESDKEEARLQQFAQLLGVTFIVKALNLKDAGHETARTWRYNAFLAVAAQEKSNALLLAHHADDQAETVLMRLLRGTGLTGLCAMKEISNYQKIVVVRPLINLSKKVIDNYVKQHNLPVSYDSSNYSMKYMRSRLRYELMPLLLSYNPAVKKNLCQLASLANSEEQAWDDVLPNILNKVICKKTNDQLILDVDLLMRYKIGLQQRLIRSLLRTLQPRLPNLSFRVIKAICSLLAADKTLARQIILSDKWRVIREYDKLKVLRNKTLECHGTPMILKIPGKNYLPFFNGLIEGIISEVQVAPRTVYVDYAVLDYDLITEKLVVRSRYPGDRIACLGMMGLKKVKNEFIDVKIPRSCRERIPLVCMGKQIIWIPTVRRSRYALITPRTTKYLHLFWSFES